ncbi:MAG TPA: DUF4403 family protein [Arthrobacter sp.]
MNPTLHRTLTLLVVGIPLGLGACRSRSLDIPGFVADTAAPATPPVQLPPSYVSAPIAFDLRPVLAELEAELPRKFGSLDRKAAIKVKINNAPDLELAPELTRGPLEIGFKDNTLTLSGVIEYRAKAWTKIGFVTTSVSCGTGTDVPRIRFAARVSYDLTPTWHLKTKSELLSLEPYSKTERDQCEVTAAKINATGLVADKARGAIAGVLTKLDQKMARVSLEKPIGGVWATLQRPISISKGMLWLEIGPQAISLGPITAKDSILTARLDLLAAPKMLSGSRPPDGTLPLPPLGRTSASADTAIMAVDGILLYSVASDILRKKLAGKYLTRFRQVKVDDVTLLPAGRGRIVIAIRVKGKLNGTFYVVGQPYYDPSTDLITIPDLGFDVQSAGTLERFASWVMNGKLLEIVKKEARFEGTALLAEAVKIANKELNRQLSEGIHLRGELSSARPVNVVATRDGLVAQARASGRIWLEISKTDLIPGGAKKTAKVGG